MNKPYAPACDRNRHAILEVLQKEIIGQARLLEIGSGTGQHAVYMARHLPEVQWYTSDCEDMIEGINTWIDDENSPNIHRPLTLDVSRTWPVNEAFDVIFTANTLHIMSWQSVEDFFSGVGKHLLTGGKLCVYGPFNYNGTYTSESNAEFDQWLKQRNPDSAIRDAEAVDALASAQGLEIVNDYAMPANNRLRVWKYVNAT